MYTAIVPAAGVGKRMQADRPKQYLRIADKTVLEHTLSRLISHPLIKHIVLVLDPQDPYFYQLPLANAPWITPVDGGSERANSVLNGLAHCKMEQWALVHDAARPCVSHQDITALLSLAEAGDIGGILATPVKDTMKRAAPSTPENIARTECRDGLWHALTPQFFPAEQLYTALNDALASGANITDEASAIEWAGGSAKLIEGSASNIKITRPEDLALAAFYLQESSLC